MNLDVQLAPEMIHEPVVPDSGAASPDRPPGKQTSFLEPDATTSDALLEIEDLSLWYGSTQALHGVNLQVPRNKVTALIGPSGCGKSTLLRSINRMNDLIPDVRVRGRIAYEGVDVNGPQVDPVDVRRRIGMVFQKANPFPKSIYDNVAYGPRLHGAREGLDELVERSLRSAALWDEVKDKLRSSGLGLSGGQQQRLCIARAMATGPDLILMDEPTSALDPVATDRIERLIHEIKERYTVIIVTHNMQQAGRVSDVTAFMHLGQVVEVAPTDDIFTNPRHELTERYVTGRFG